MVFSRFLAAQYFFSHKNKKYLVAEILILARKIQKKSFRNVYFMLNECAVIIALFAAWLLALNWLTNKAIGNKVFMKLFFLKKKRRICDFSAFDFIDSAWWSRKKVYWKAKLCRSVTILYIDVRLFSRLISWLSCKMFSMTKHSI